VDVPDAIYNYPSNRFVATTVGSPPTNFVPVKVMDAAGKLELRHPAFTLRAGGSEETVRMGLVGLHVESPDVWAAVRPEDIHLSEQRESADSFPAKVSVVEPLGSETIVDVILGPDIIKAIIPPAQHLSEGQEIWAGFDKARVHLFDPKTERRFYTSSAEEPLLPSAP
jgi:multiple sugar transport system ATP-binding protein